MTVSSDELVNVHGCKIVSQGPVTDTHSHHNHDGSTEPTLPNLPASRVVNILRPMMQEYFRGFKWNDEMAEKLVDKLTRDLMDRLRDLGLKKHKFIVNIALGQKKGQGLKLMSRCIWNNETDGVVSETFQNEDIFVACEVFAVR